MNSKFNNSELILSLAETHTAILQEASQLSSEEQNTVFLGVWSVVDLIANLVGWDFTKVLCTRVRYVQKQQNHPYRHPGADG